MIIENGIIDPLNLIYKEYTAFKYYLGSLPSLHKGGPFFSCVQMQEPSTLLHNPYLQFSEQFCRQPSPYIPLSQAIKYNNPNYF